ncbi:GcrA cell cycle regulator [Rhodoplanes sp. Z2-YC6860]|nr:GcrA cell cycle regulator [Rhodoplanes sp. Z2-YC6860]
MIWSEEHDRIIIENRGRMSASLIAELIGGGCTRSAVLGRARRLGLKKLSRHDPARSMRPRAVSPWPVTINPCMPLIPDVPPVVDALIPFEQRKTLLTLGPRDCHWPVGDPQAEDFFFCGAERSGHASYCAAHLQRALRPPRASSDAKNVTRNFNMLPVRAFGPGAAPADRWLRDTAA